MHASSTAPVAPPLTPSAPHDTPQLALRQITARAVITGMLIGGLLSLCNIYSGLKIGWSNSMSVTAALLGFAMWRGFATMGAKPFSILENNISQTAASSAAAVSSAGLVAGVPALTLLTGYQFTWPVLAAWVFSVCMVGIVVGMGLRRQMIEIQKLPFPNGVATAETLREIHGANSGGAAARVYMLLATGAAAAVVKLTEKLAGLKQMFFPGTFQLGAAGKVTAGNLTFGFEPSLLMVGVGGLIGLRGGVSLLIGGLLAYGVLSPLALSEGWASPGKPGEPWFGALNKWLLWPGVAMMVTASLTSFAFSWRSIAATFSRKARRARAASMVDAGDVPVAWFFGGLALAAMLSVALQSHLFGIAPVIAVLGVLISFLLAMVAARVAGETNVTPVGAMGKVTQLVFGALTPGQIAPNLMAANVTGGAASQCADLMHDLKTGYVLGALARYQTIAQCFGALAGALMGSAAYLILIPDPATQLMTPEWPAPAVATWKAVAEIFAKGFDSLPPFTPIAAAIGAGLGIALAMAEKLIPGGNRWLPSASAMGLAFVLPFYNALQMFVGAVLAALATRYAKTWSETYLVVIAAGIIAGESLMGVAIAIHMLLAG